VVKGERRGRGPGLHSLVGPRSLGHVLAGVSWAVRAAD